jgi:hypothetical protein
VTSLVHSPVSSPPECGKALSDAPLVLKAREGTNGSVQLNLGSLSLPLSGLGVLISSNAFLNPRHGLFHSLNGDALSDVGSDGHSPWAVANRRASVEGVVSPLLGSDDHSRPASAAAKDSEAGQEAIGFRSSPAGDLDSLDGLPEVSIHDRLMGVEVDQRSEVNLPKVGARGEHGLNPVVAPLDAVLAKELTDNSDRLTLCSKQEGSSDRLSVLIRYKHSVRPTRVARRHLRVRGDSSCDGHSLSSAGAFLHHPPLVLRNRSEHRPLKPQGSRSARYVTDVKCDHATPCDLHSRDDLALDREGAHKAVEVSDHQHLGLPSLNALDSRSQSLSSLKRRSPRDVDLLMGGDELQPVPLASRRNTLSLLSRTDEALAFTPRYTRDADDSNGPPHKAGRLLHKRPVVSARG